MKASHLKELNELEQNKLEKPIYLEINYNLYPEDFNIWFYKDDKIFIEKLKLDEYQNKYFKYKKKYLNLKY